MRGSPAAAVVAVAEGGGAEVVAVAAAARVPVVVVADAVAAARAAEEGEVASGAVRGVVECGGADARAVGREVVRGIWRDAGVVGDRAVEEWGGGAVADDPMSGVGEAETLGAREADVEWLIA